MLFDDDERNACISCDGEGRIVDEAPCPDCFGMGGRLDIGSSPLGSIKKTCISCGGSGVIKTEKKCWACNGTGRSRF